MESVEGCGRGDASVDFSPNGGITARSAGQGIFTFGASRNNISDLCGSW